MGFMPDIDGEPHEHATRRNDILVFCLYLQDLQFLFPP